jgi:hypothetical protein
MFVIVRPSLNDKNAETDKMALVETLLRDHELSFQPMLDARVFRGYRSVVR